jgi:hypothetical protein
MFSLQIYMIDKDQIATILKAIENAIMKIKYKN